MTLNLINRVEHQRKEPPPVSGILKKYYRGQWRNIYKFDNNLACFVCFTQKFSVARGSEISIVRPHYRNFWTPHYRKFLCKADETSF